MRSLENQVQDRSRAALRSLDIGPNSTVSTLPPPGRKVLPPRAPPDAPGHLVQEQGEGGLAGGSGHMSTSGLAEGRVAWSSVPITHMRWGRRLGCWRPKTSQGSPWVLATFSHPLKFLSVIICHCRFCLSCLQGLLKADACTDWNLFLYHHVAWLLDLVRTPDNLDPFPHRL